MIVLFVLSFYLLIEAASEVALVLSGVATSSVPCDAPFNVQDNIEQDKYEL